MYFEQQSSSWYVGVPGMSSLGNLFDINASVQLHSEVKQLTFDHQTWTLSYRFGEEDIHESFDELILAIPAQQALSLLQGLTFANPDKGSDLNQIVHFLSQIQMYPCWTLMVKSDQQFFHQWHMMLISVQRARWRQKQSHGLHGTLPSLIEKIANQQING